MTLPRVSLITGKVGWTPPTTNDDGSAITPGEVTGYTVGLRSLTAQGSAIGTYPVLSPITSATAVSDALSAISANLKEDDYGVSVRTESTLGPSAWGTEFQFTGVLPRPNPPTAIAAS